MESIIAAVISAMASVVVALINRGRAPARSDADPRTASDGRTRPNRLWPGSVLALLAWLVVAFFLLGDPTALVINALVVIPIVSVVLAYVSAPQPLIAASGVFAIHAGNAVLMAFSDIRGFMIGGVSDILILLTIFGVNAGLATGAARWALAGRRHPRHLDATDTTGGARSRDATLASELSELARLRAEGHLSEEEFELAKRKAFHDRS